MRRMSLVVLLLAGCPGEPPPPCITVDTACAPGYVPTFMNVYNNTLHEGCGARSSCHSASGRAGGLSLADIDTAYTQLLDPAEGRVKPGDPACSEMIVRTNSPGKDYEMPPELPLTAETQCALVQWVQMGAPR